MSSTIIDAGRQPRTLRGRLARVGGATAVLAVILMGATVPPAHAVQNGDWILDGTLGKLGLPGFAVGTAVDARTGDIYMTDWTNDGFHKFSSTGEHLFLRGEQGTGEGQFNDPSGIAVDDYGNVYVADTYNDRVQKFNSDGNFITQWGGEGTLDGEFDTPRGIGVDGFGNVFVADTNNDRIQKFSGVGKWLKTWGTTGTENTQFQRPEGIAASPDGNLFVADRMNNRIQVFTNDGVWLRTWGTEGFYQGQFKDPGGIAVDEDGDVYVADFGNNRVQKLSGQGTPLKVWSVAAPTGPIGVAVNRAADRVYIAAGQQTPVYREVSTPMITVGPKSWADAGKWYSSTLKATGYPTVSAWAVTSGVLPTGLRLAGGKIYGIPTKPGTYQVTLRADNGVLPLSSKSYTIKVYKASSKVTAKFSTKYPRAAWTRVKATIKLSAPYTTGLSKTGKVRVYYGKKRVKTYTVRASHKGVIKVRLPKFTKKGKTKVTLRYLGNSQLKSAKRTITVRVR